MVVTTPSMSWTVWAILSQLFLSTQRMPKWSRIAARSWLQWWKPMVTLSFILSLFSHSLYLFIVFIQSFSLFIHCIHLVIIFIYLFYLFSHSLYLFIVFIQSLSLFIYSIYLVIIFIQSSACQTFFITTHFFSILLFVTHPSKFFYFSNQGESG